VKKSLALLFLPLLSSTSFVLAMDSEKSITSHPGVRPERQLTNEDHEHHSYVISAVGNLLFSKEMTGEESSMLQQAASQSTTDLIERANAIYAYLCPFLPEECEIPMFRVRTIRTALGLTLEEITERASAIISRVFPLLPEATTPVTRACIVSIAIELTSKEIEDRAAAVFTHIFPLLPEGASLGPRAYLTNRAINLTPEGIRDRAIAARGVLSLLPQDADPELHLEIVAEAINLTPEAIGERAIAITNALARFPEGTRPPTFIKNAFSHTPQEIEEM
jgi:hypothetical protein